MFSGRFAGVLCHPTSFPGPYGVGEIGARARIFLDDLAAAGQAYWQVLPLNPTGHGSSPYSATSSFAGNTLLIDLDDLIARGLIAPSEVQDLIGLRADRVDFDKVVPARQKLLDLAGERLASQTSGPGAAARDAFIAQYDSDWLDDYALWEAISRSRERAHWIHWPDELRLREESALKAARVALSAQIAREKALQFLFHDQWCALREHGRQVGVHIIGDMPIFVSQNSADVWARPELFKLDDQSRCTVVAGVPPDYFSATGQLWGNPVYRWDRMEADGFSWWEARIRQLLSLVDIVRIDHFRGFAATWETPAQAQTAESGAWAPASGEALFAHLKKSFPQMPFIAEDLGHITEDVIALRDRFDLPGLKILQFSFGNGPPSGEDHPSAYPSPSVCYPATHDNNTMVGWLRNDGLDRENRASDAEREAKAALAAANCTPDNFAEAITRMAMLSGSGLALVQMQDVMGLSGSARMNTPGTVNAQNWAWRFAEGQVTEDMWRALKQAAVDGGRGMHAAERLK